MDASIALPDGWRRVRVVTINTNQQNMKIYTEVVISAHHAGFGMFERGELNIGPENSWAYEPDLLAEIANNSELALPIEEAVVDASFIALGVEDIRGKIYNQPSAVFARIDRYGELSYFGIEETEVEDSFFSPATATLHDYKTGEAIRPATADELAASIEAAKQDGGVGAISIDGRACYAQE